MQKRRQKSGELAGRIKEERRCSNRRRKYEREGKKGTINIVGGIELFSKTAYV